MKPSDLLSLIEVRKKSSIKRPLHIESSPGLGKTQIAYQAAERLKIGFKIVHAPTLQPEDVGFPVVDKVRNNVEFVIPLGKFPMQGSDCPEEGILLIDEMPQADNSMQKVFANLLQEREIHGQKLKPGWMLITTGNRTTDRAGANRILSHLKNRITTVELEANLDDWCDWALKNAVPQEVISFLRFKPNLLNAFDAQQEMNPTPRSWAEGVGAQYGKLPAHMELAVYRGDIGEGAAAEFMAFVKTWRELITIEEVLKTPAKAKLADKRPDVLFAMVGSLIQHANAENFDKLFTYVKRMPKEFSVVFIKDAVKLCPAIAKQPDFIAWIRGEGAQLLAETG